MINKAKKNTKKEYEMYGFGAYINFEGKIIHRKGVSCIICRKKEKREGEFCNPNFNPNFKQD